ncbi:hypothetical protein R3P38DRAFT_2768503 [Favolaschia claudopus]|uniref:Uncharacterized protein n=1 Tax=Favolaschia claudopus TaxID=2862362 RepID=A0AAW0CSU5_9AGAR
MVSLYLVYKIYGQGRKIGTSFEHRFSDGDKYRGKWHFNPTTVAWVGNPIDSAKVQDTMVAIKNKCGMDGGDRKHSLAMSEEFMSRITVKMRAHENRVPWYPDFHVPTL